MARKPTPEQCKRHAEVSSGWTKNYIPERNAAYYQRVTPEQLKAGQIRRRIEEIEERRALAELDWWAL